MKNFLKSVLLSALFLVTMMGAPSAEAVPFKVKQPLWTTETLRVDGASTLTGNVSVGGTLTATGAVALTAPLTSANIASGSAKRMVFRHAFASNIATGTAADGATYTHMIFPPRPGVVTRISWGAITAPIGGTSTLTVKKGTGGNTMLSTATVDPTTLADGVRTDATLTSTAADLAITTGGIEVSHVAGTQTTDAVGLSVMIEFEPTDF